ncbi:NAD(P)H-hydrate dehydratase [Azospirillum thermophilum]|uniref:ADP-dependent (S)-NAD(P)H-hydrate dehydratase n=1 Tax=Azospirillum thermophilum TaxID=2202148 RepID=A0A2S2CSE0_9PROT|nr:NAD(P)H-hydrate dehydratase [Azospirillum thermophilum]AWK87345.1 NAD(P)H-hydrate dehydratase [Azospirillum thermophilum]
MSDPVAVTPELLRRTPLPRPSEEGDKEERGRVLVVAGSVQVPGGALLAGIGALRAGAGKLQIATCASVAPHLGLAVPEALVAGLPETAEGGISPDAATALIERARRCDAVLIGPGMMDRPAVAALAGALLRGLDGPPDGPSLLLDAGALAALEQAGAAPPHRAGRMVVTPHSGEMASLLGMERADVSADPPGVALRAARQLGAVVALKGSCTHIATPEGARWAYDRGRVGLATSGSGDTLAGIVAGLLARGAPPEVAAIWAVYLHGEAGNRLARRHGPLGYLARELLAEVPAILAELCDWS